MLASGGKKGGDLEGQIEDAPTGSLWDEWGQSKTSVELFRMNKVAVFGC